MLAEVLACLRPVPGDVAVDCTLGGGGHARAILERIQPGGRLIGLDTDGGQLARTEAGFRTDGVGAHALTALHGNFSALSHALATAGVTAGANVVVADLGVSSMQLEDAERGFSYKVPGPLDMRIDRTRGEPAADLLARLPADDVARLLATNADEPHAEAIARILKAARTATTHAAERAIRTGLETAMPHLTKSEIKLSVRRTFQALRIAVNDEYGALEALLRELPACLAPGGRAAILTFHSGEDRRVKKAFRDGLGVGIYAAIAKAVIRSSKAETYSNRRAQAAKLRWALRALPPPG